MRRRAAYKRRGPFLIRDGAESRHGDAKEERPVLNPGRSPPPKHVGGERGEARSQSGTEPHADTGGWKRRSQFQKGCHVPVPGPSPTPDRELKNKTKNKVNKAKKQGKKCSEPDAPTESKKATILPIWDQASSTESKKVVMFPLRDRARHADRELWKRKKRKSKVNKKKKRINAPGPTRRQRAKTTSKGTLANSVRGV